MSMNRYRYLFIDKGYGFPGDADSKESACNVEDPGLINWSILSFQDYLSKHQFELGSAKLNVAKSITSTGAGDRFL